MRTIEPVETRSPGFLESFPEPRSCKTATRGSAFVIREIDDKGRGVFSAEPIAQGAVALVGKPVSAVPERTWQTVQMGVATHVRMDEPFELVNHSCDPNCGVRPNRYGGYDLVAMRTIAAEEEIAFDYCMSEWVCVGFRECRCNSPRCRGIIRGAKFLSGEKLEEYRGYTAPYLRLMSPATVG